MSVQPVEGKEKDSEVGSTGTGSTTSINQTNGGDGRLEAAKSNPTVEF